jgi:hypothetical protein
MKRHPEQDAKPIDRRQGERPVTGWGSRQPQLSALLCRKSKAPVTLPTLKFMSGDDEDERR